MVTIGAAPASAQTCIQDEYNIYNQLTSHPKKLSCTAGDVSITNVTNVQIISGGIGGRCTEGSSCTFAADFLIQTTSNKTRSNIGLFFGLNSATNQNGAISGDCANFILSPTYQCPDDTSLTCGDPTYEELDQAINGEGTADSSTTGGCGDTSSTDDNGTGQQTATFDIGSVHIPASGPSLVPCAAPLTGTCYELPECTSWYQPTTNVPVCEAVPTDFPWSYSHDAVPGTTSKCNCTALQIPVQPVVPKVDVAKACSIDGGSTYSDACNFSGPNLEGGTVTYKVTITNKSDDGGVDVDQICDNRYGQIWPTDGTGTCATGTVGSIIDGSSSSCGSLGDITTSAYCTFQVNHGEDLSVTDQVSVYGHSDVPDTSIPLSPNPTQSGTVTVTSGQNPSTATTNKGLDGASIGSACTTVNYNVTVTNTSSPDETLTLSVPSGGTALNDSAYNDITSLHGDTATTGSVVGTTCGVDSSGGGLGTLSGMSGSGAFPISILPSGTYTCHFAGVLCGTIGTVPEPGTGTCSTGDTGDPGMCTAGQSSSTPCMSNAACDATCSGIGPQTDAVTAHLTGDEGEAVSQTENPFYVSVCIAPTGVGSGSQ